MLISKSKYAFESTVIFNITRLDVWIVSIENRTIRSYFVTSSWYIVIQSIYYSNQYTVFKVPISFIYLSAVFDSCWSISNLLCFVNTFLKNLNCWLWTFVHNGDGEIRTLDPLLARQVLSQLSYAPVVIWQPPTFPYRYQYSIIGRLSLNHRVRDENGCFPKTHRHQKYAVIYW